MTKEEKFGVDIQNFVPEIQLRINRVGVKGVRRRVIINSPEGAMTFDVTLDAFVDLPPQMRAIHMSRNIEAFIEAIDEARIDDALSFEEMLERICKKLLLKHPYASRAEAVAATTYYYIEDFTGKDIPEAADISIDVIVQKDGHSERTVSVSILGMTACPSAQATYSSVEKTPISKTPTHTQRTKLTLSAKSKGKVIRIEWLVNAARSAFSAPVVSLLKKKDEHYIVKTAIENPRLVEDVLRFALNNIYNILAKEKFPGDTVIKVEAESYESIHPHNAYACREVTLKELMIEADTNSESLQEAPYS